MRVIYVTSSLPYGSGEAFLIPEVVELVRQGHEVLMVPMYPRGVVIHDDVKPLMARVVSRSLFSAEVLRSAVSELTRNPAGAAKSLGCMFRSRNSRILVKNLAVYPKGLWLADLAQRWGAEHIHVHWAATTATMALVAGELSGISWSVTAHRWDIAENNLLDLKLEHVAFARFISQSGLNTVRSLGVKVKDEKAFVLHMGVFDTSPETLAKESAGSHSSFPPVVICPANMLVVKGHRYLLEAASILRERGIRIRVWLAGDGELRETLEIEAKARGLAGMVRFLGQLPHPELMRLYREEEVSAVVLPSLDLGNGEHEGIPVSLIEAMGSGVPVLSTVTGGIPELLEGGAGLLVPPEDPYALADGIQQLIEDPEQRRRLARAGRERVKKEFAVDKVAARLAARFDACAKGETGTKK